MSTSCVCSTKMDLKNRGFRNRGFLNLDISKRGGGVKLFQEGDHSPLFCDHFHRNYFHPTKYVNLRPFLAKLGRELAPAPTRGFLGLLPGPVNEHIVTSVSTRTGLHFGKFFGNLDRQLDEMMCGKVAARPAGLLAVLLVVGG